MSSRTSNNWQNFFHRCFQFSFLASFLTATLAFADIKPLSKSDAEKILKGKYPGVKVSLVFDGLAHGEHAIFGAKTVTTVVGIANGKPMREVLTYDEEFGWVTYTFSSDQVGNPLLIIFTVSGKKEVKGQKVMTPEEIANDCIRNLRQIDGAKQQWSVEHKKRLEDVPTEAELSEYFSGGKFPKCPGGGSYTINSVKGSPECSKFGHKLPE